MSDDYLQAMEIIGEQDAAIIPLLLGRPVDSCHAVAARCVCGVPSVVVPKPVHGPTRRQIFTTLFWLTCPFLGRMAAALEAEGMIRIISREVDLSVQEEATRRYVAGRLALCGVLGIDLAALPQGIAKSLSQTGIGGIRDPRGLKCLHLHLAHFLATGDNPTGRRVMEMISQRPDRCQGVERELVRAGRTVGSPGKTVAGGES